jgi:hexosaminidase
MMPTYFSKIVLTFLMLFPVLLHARTDKDSIKPKVSQVIYPDLNLMPMPASVKMKSGNFRLTQDFSISIKEETNERLYNAANRFLRRLDGRTGLFFKQGIISKANPQPSTTPGLTITVKRIGKLVLGEDESYKLSVSPERISLDAVTDIGAIRGLETLLQLLTNNEEGYYFHGIEIDDAPRFQWRGLMIDAARHFMPMEVIKRNLDGMAAVKMNVMHFHLHDNHGWRVESKTFPLLHKMASDGLYYTQVQIKEIVEYAADRGIRVMPEFDVPGHATAILVAYPELASAPGPYVLERNTGIFDPTLNPTIDKTYTFLDKLFTEMSGLFPDEYFHIGGDENNGVHWKANPEIKAFMKKNDFKTVLQLETYFNNKLIKTIKKIHKKMVGWDEILQPGLSQDAIIHSWRGKSSLFKAASQGYKTILSNGFYIDLLQPAEEHYKNDPLPDFQQRTAREKYYELSPEQEKLILGGEATMWTELVTPLNIDSRIWPRTAAIAERLWSPGVVNDVNDMYRRLDNVSFRLEELGLTHVTNRDLILRNNANGGDVSSLKILVEAIEPYKIYTRNNGNLIYKSYSPFTLMPDAATADAKDARIFRKLVADYSSNPKKEIKEQLLSYLNMWKGNHENFLKVMKQSPVLKPMEKLSEKLSKLGAIGLEAVEKGKCSEDWCKEKSAYIKSIKDDTQKKKESDTIFEDGRTELVILDAIQQLIILASPVK